MKRRVRFLGFTLIWFISIMLFSLKNVYGTVDVFRIKNIKDETVINADDFFYENMSVDGQNKLYIPGGNDAHIYIELPSKTKYLQINVSDVVSKTEIVLEIYFPTDGGYNEQNKVVRKLKDGSNIIGFVQSAKGIIRVDLDSTTDSELKINSVCSYNTLPITFDFLFFLFEMILISFIVFIIIKERNKLLFLYQKNKKEIYVILFFLVSFSLWSFIIPYNQGPDEFMRFDVVKYIYNYKSLPRGDDPILCTSNGWGTSYAYSPYLAYLIGAIFMQMAASFGGIGAGLLHAARLVSVFSSVATLVFLIKISKELNLKNTFLLPCFVGLLPQFTFISSYVNNDSFAIMSTSIIIYAWILGLKSMWDRRSCIYLSIGMALCVASYYNCYGYLLVSFILFVSSYIYVYTQKKNVNVFIDLLKKGLIILLCVCLVSGWWFVRNYILYNGDILGNSVNTATAMKYALPELNPLNKKSLFEQGISLKTMLIDMRWILGSMRSFVGAFGYMAIYLSEWIYCIYAMLILMGLGLRLNMTLKLQKVKQLNKKKILFDVALLFSVLIVLLLSIIYSYFSDFQPQGRYLLPMVIPLMLWVAEGFQNSNLVSKKIKSINYIYLIIFVLGYINFYALGLVIIPYYYW